MRHECGDDEKKLQLLNELIGGHFTPEEYSVVNHFTYNAAFGASSSFVEAGLAGLAYCYGGLMGGTNDAVDTARSAGAKAGWQTAKYNWKQVVREDLDGASAGSMARRQLVHQFDGANTYCG